MDVYDLPDAATYDQAIFFSPAKKKKNRLIAGYWYCFYRDANEANLFASKHDHELELEETSSGLASFRSSGPRAATACRNGKKEERLGLGAERGKIIFLANSWPRFSRLMSPRVCSRSTVT